MIDLIVQQWPWYVAGPILGLIMLALIYFGETFGISSSFRTICAIGGAQKVSDYFNINIREYFWNLTFIIGSMLGGYIAIHYLTPDRSILLSSGAVEKLESYGFNDPGADYLPAEIFGMVSFNSIQGIALLLIGGILVGFGARYADGCTSGHAITGLSNLQVPSLIAVVGFFIGGLLMVHVLMPHIF